MTNFAPSLAAPSAATETVAYLWIPKLRRWSKTLASKWSPGNKSTKWRKPSRWSDVQGIQGVANSFYSWTATRSWGSEGSVPPAMANFQEDCKVCFWTAKCAKKEKKEAAKVAVFILRSLAHLAVQNRRCNRPGQTFGPPVKSLVLW